MWAYRRRDTLIEPIDIKESADEAVAVKSELRRAAPDPLDSKRLLEFAS